MSHIHQFKNPIQLKDGRRLKMLSEAEAFIIALPMRRQAQDHWQYTAQLLMKARRPMASELIVDSLAKQLAFALETEGLI